MSFLPDDEKRYEVYFEDCSTSLCYDRFEDADHCARLNAGCVLDTLTYEVVRTYTESYE